MSRNANILKRLSPTDEKIISRIDTNYEKNFWDFKKSNRKFAHSYFKYPAMMVPDMQGELIDLILDLNNDIKTIMDPFIGSGTVMVESMIRGKNFYGQDINPLAILLCKVKSGPYKSKILIKRIKALLLNIEDNDFNYSKLIFNNIDKWFKPSAQESLSKIREAILKEKFVWVRRFLWVVLAEVIRLSSNSRTSTFKLHIRTKEDIENRTFNVIELFKKQLNKNLNNYIEMESYLNENNFLEKGRYKKNIGIFYGDSKVSLCNSNKADLLITSPPYGDNHTTVTYGQFSYLPLQWIKLSDIDKKVPNNVIEKISEIDNHSLGGKKKRVDKDLIDSLLNKSKTLKEFLNKLEINSENYNKVVNFFIDLEDSLDKITNCINSNGYLIWTVGNRNVGGNQVDLDKILVEMFELKNVFLLKTVERQILNKTMAIKNKRTKTMSKEIILILKKD